MDWVQNALHNFAASPYFWDIITFACLGIALTGVMAGVVWVLGLPGRIAIARNHPDAEAVYLMGWVGFAAVVPWIQALIWAYKPTEKIDIRYFPEAEAAAERESLEKLSLYVYGKKGHRRRVELAEKKAKAAQAERGPGPEMARPVPVATPASKPQEERPAPDASGTVDTDKKD